MSLAYSPCGLGGCWSGWHTNTGRNRRQRAKLEVADHCEFRSLCRSHPTRTLIFTRKAPSRRLQQPASSSSRRAQHQNCVGARCPGAATAVRHRQATATGDVCRNPGTPAAANPGPCRSRSAWHRSLRNGHRGDACGVKLRKRFRKSEEPPSVRNGVGERPPGAGAAANQLRWGDGDLDGRHGEARQGAREDRRHDPARGCQDARC